jgi:hypothetical protein
MPTITPTARRLLVAVVTALLIALNNKLGLGLSETQTAEITALALGYITQSAVRQGKAEK